MDDETLSDIERKAERKMRHRHGRSNTLWFGLGTMGIVGWSIVVPVILGIMAGLYLDEQTSVSFSWTLTGLLVGVVVGSLNAWFWVSRKQQEIQERRERDGENS